MDTPEEINRVTEDAIAASEEGATEWFLDELDRAARVVAKRLKVFTADDIWDEAGEGIFKRCPAATPSALGPVLRQLKAEGVIYLTGEYRESKLARQHRKPQRVWRAA